MAVIPSPKTKETEQHLVNLSFDQEFNVLVAEMLGYDGTNLVRVSVDANGVLQIA